MSSSGSENEARMGYQPVLAERLRTALDSPSAQSSPGQWPRDAMNVYTNDLFKDEMDMMGDPGHAPQQAVSGSSQKMMAQKSALAARRQERLQANIYQSNSNTMTRAPAGAGGPPRPPPLEPANLPDNQGALQSVDSSSVFGLRGTYDPNEERPRSVAVSGGMAGMVNNPRPPPPPAALDLSNLPSFLMQPGPKEGMPIMCYIVRDKGSAKMYPRYNLYLEDPKMFLLAARKRKKQTTSNYLVSLDPEDLNRDSSKFFGKLRANFVGTEFTIFDGGDKPDKSRASEAGSRLELGSITYQYNVLGTRGPRKMTGVIPALDSYGRRLYRPASEADNIIERMKNNKGVNELVVMHNKPPRWNDELNAYCLNFNGRVTEASVKNFQLVTDENQNHVILQFGKIGKNTFTMDYMWPISAFQAFSICLSSFDNKLACE